MQGKTDQAKADLGRLAKIRAEREAAQAKRKAEAEGAFIRLFGVCARTYWLFQQRQQTLKPRRKPLRAGNAYNIGNVMQSA